MPPMLRATASWWTHCAQPNGGSSARAFRCPLPRRSPSVTPSCCHKGTSTAIRHRTVLDVRFARQLGETFDGNPAPHLPHGPPLLARQDTGEPARSNRPLADVGNEAAGEGQTFAWKLARRLRPQRRARHGARAGRSLPTAHRGPAGGWIATTGQTRSRSPGCRALRGFGHVKRASLRKVAASEAPLVANSGSSRYSRRPWRNSRPHPRMGPREPGCNRQVSERGRRGRPRPRAYAKQRPRFTTGVKPMKKKTLCLGIALLLGVATQFSAHAEGPLSMASRLDTIVAAKAHGMHHRRLQALHLPQPR